MAEQETPQSGIILYQTEDGRTRIQCRFEDETIWLTQVLIAELFQTSVPNINLHLKAIYAEGELAEPATIKSYLIVRSEGRRQVSRGVLHCSLSTSVPNVGPPVDGARQPDRERVVRFERDCVYSGRGHRNAHHKLSGS